ncbi:hypothetical protein OC845_000475 [Tilletia horrida]|nr:hypothetical protein OC845_000475 [Tilletia horrida]
MSKRISSSGATAGVNMGNGPAHLSSSASKSAKGLPRASIPFDQLVSLQKRSWQLLCSLEELQGELLMGGEGVVMQWPQLLSRLSGLLSHLVFLSSSLTSPQTAFYSSQLNALEASLRREANTANLFSPTSADQPNEARDAIRAKPHQLPANVGRLRFSDVAVAAPRAGNQAQGSSTPSDRTGNKLPFLVVHPFEPLPGMAVQSNGQDEGKPGPAQAPIKGEGRVKNEASAEAGGPAPTEDPAAVGQHLNYLYNLLRTRPDDTVSAEEATFLQAALPVLLPEFQHIKDGGSIPTQLNRAQTSKLRRIQKQHDRQSLRALRTWFHLAAATDENGIRYDWKTRVGAEDLDALLAPDESGAGAEEQAVMEEDLEEEGGDDDSDADMEDAI